MNVRTFIQRHLRRGFKFALVGSLGAIESLILQYLLTEYLGIHYMLSAILGIGVAMTNNYFLNYKFTFSDRLLDEKSEYWMKYAEQKMKEVLELDKKYWMKYAEQKMKEVLELDEKVKE